MATIGSMSPASREVPKNLAENHPLPWQVVHESDIGSCDVGGIKDAQGDWVIWLGGCDQYYNTSGYAEEGVLEKIVELINKEET
jgi:hypothetical protein